MPIIGVTHCPSCGAVVNAHWPSCLACSSTLEPSKPEHSSFRVQASKEPAPPKLKAVSRVVAVQPGMTVHYPIPVKITSPTNYDWEWHCGTIELVDEDWQRIRVIPETEEQPWRWVPRCYVSKETP